MIARQANRLGDQLERLTALDDVATTLAGKVSPLLERTGAKHVLSGAWAGHPVHPPLTDLPIGAWTSAMVLDLVGGQRAQPAADLLVAMGVVTAAPTIASGLSDWTDIGPRERRVGLVHAAANLTGLVCYSASLLARRGGRRGWGVALGFAGAGVLTVGGFLGGHLAFRRGVGVDRNAFGDGPTKWTTLEGIDAAPAAGEMALGRAEDTDVVLVGQGGRSTPAALADRCSHQGGPLHEGTLADGCVRCPWHASEFAVVDGAVVRGPATAPQPVYEVRTSNGALEARRSPAEVI